MIQVGDKFKINAVYNGKYWKNFGIIPKLANVYGEKREDIKQVEITVKEIDIWLSDWYKNNDQNATVYFGYYDYEDGYRHSLMRCNVKAYDCCFPYGADKGCWRETANGDKKRIGTTFIFEVNYQLLKNFGILKDEKDN